MTKEEAIGIISGYEAYGCGYCLQGGEEIEEALKLAVDALKQELIHCRDCKYWVEVPYGHICDWTTHQKQSGEGYCELAKKRKEE